MISGSTRQGRRVTAPTMACAITLFFGACAGPTEAPRENQARRSAAITDGVLDTGHPAVGLLLIDASGGQAKSVCSGTVVGSKTVLTATHCLEMGKPTLFQHQGKLYTVTQMIRRTDWVPTTSKYENDIGLAILDKAIPNAPMLPLSTSAPKTGASVILVGHGITATGLKDAGKKRTATNTIAAVQSRYFTINGTGGGIGNACQGDSGGPVLVTSGGQTHIIGVISASEAPCGIKSFHVRVDAFAPWLESKALGDIGHGADTTAPKVTITAPVQGATTTSPLTLKVDATDDVGVISVAIKVGGTTKKTLTQAPYDAVLDLTPGAHTLEVTAQDATGNAASAHVDITVSNTSPYDGGPKLHDSATLPEGGTPGTFGSPCASTGDCDKDLVCRPTVEGAATMFCTQTCIVGFATCPEGSECETRGGEAICSKPTPQRPIEGGCSAAPRHPHVKALSVLALFAIFFIALNRRRRRRG